MNPPKQQKVVTYEQRISRAISYLRSFDFVKEKLNGEVKSIAEDLMNFMEQSLTVGEPYLTDDGGLLIHAKNLSSDDPKCSVVPLFKSDKGIHEEIDAIDNPIFLEGYQSIFLPAIQLSNEWRGILMLHEALHAKYYIDGIYREGFDPHWNEEVAVFTIEHQALRDVFPGYGNKVEEAVKLVNKGVSLDDIFEEAQVSQVLSKPQSKNEIGLATTAFVFDVVYHDIDTTSENKWIASQRKALFTRSVYGE